jgi:hypothetical protein
MFTEGEVFGLDSSEKLSDEIVCTYELEKACYSMYYLPASSSFQIQLTGFGFNSLKKVLSLVSRWVPDPFCHLRESLGLWSRLVLVSKGREMILAVGFYFSRKIIYVI